MILVEGWPDIDHRDIKLGLRNQLDNNTRVHRGGRSQMWSHLDNKSLKAVLVKRREWPNNFVAKF